MSRLPPQILTFGIEWEFIIPSLTGEDSHPEDKRWYVNEKPEGNMSSPYSSPFDIFSVFREHLDEFVPFASYYDPDSEAMADEAQAWGIALAPGRALPCSYFWTVAMDGSLKALGDEDVQGNYDMDSFGMELVSRILLEHQWSEVAAVYRRLRSRMRIHVNSSCSMHVHVGSGHLDLVGYQKLTTLVLFAESFLFRCCELHRRRKNNEWCQPIATASKIAVRAAQVPLPEQQEAIANNPRLRFLLPQNTPFHLQKVVVHLWNLADIDTLRTELLIGQCNGRGAFAVRNRGGGAGFARDCTGAEVPMDPTVEFRYSHSSGDPVRDEKFTRICLALVKAASLDPEPYKATLQSFAAGQGFENFLRPLGLQADVDYWTTAEQENLRKALTPQPATQFLPEI